MVPLTKTDTNFAASFEMALFLNLLAVFLLLALSDGQILNKFSALNSRYQVYQPSNLFPSSGESTVKSLSLNRNAKQNIFNDRARIMYKPQTPIALNDGKDQEGDCPVTRPATGYSSFKQVS